MSINTEQYLIMTCQFVAVPVTSTAVALASAAPWFMQDGTYGKYIMLGIDHKASCYPLCVLIKFMNNE